MGLMMGLMGARRQRVEGTMEDSWWLGIGMGLIVIGLHAAARALTHRLAFWVSGRHTFLLFELGGLGGRMGLVLGAVALVLLYVPVQEVAFVGTVIALLLASMIAEVRYIIRRIDRDTLGS